MRGQLMGDGKAKSVIEYLDNLIEKGKATPGAITPLKVSFSKILQTIDGEAWESVDVRSIDVDDYVARFANLTMGRYTPDILISYKSRINKAIAWYIQFLDKPGWMPDVQRRTRTPKPAPAAKIAGPSVEPKPVVDQPQSMSSVASAPGRILYPYPLLDGQLVHVSLPIRFSKQDAKRLSAFIESIAMTTQDLDGQA